MSLDITFKQMRTIFCPHCGKPTGREVVRAESSGGRVWYDFLEPIGYYVPHHLRTEENDWYAKDMVLTPEQMRFAHGFSKGKDVYDSQNICGLIADAFYEGDDVVVNANW